MNGLTISRGPGGLPGLDVHAGAWLALEEKGIVPDRLAGCSAGAITSAFQAAGMTAREFVGILRALKTKDVVRKRIGWKARVFWITHFLKSEPIKELLDKYLPESFAQLETPLSVSAARMDPGSSPGKLFTSGPNLRAAVQASASISGVWDYVEVDGHPYSDGGTTDAIIVPEDHKGHLLILDPYRYKDYAKRDRNMISRLLANIDMYSQQEREATRAQLKKDGTPYTYIRLPMGEASMLEFDHDLINRTFDMMMEKEGFGK